MKFNVLILSVCIVFFIDAQAQNHKYDLWKIPSYFRGFNILPIVTHKVEDYRDLKESGANLAQLNIDGFYFVDPLYEINKEAILATDRMVAFCDSVGIYYTISVRSGPGRRDVYFESEEGAPPSTIWTNKEEQIKYAEMLRYIVNKYEDDKLFVGICPIVEPNPLFQHLLILNAKEMKDSLDNNGIDMKAIYQLFIDEVRMANDEIPIIIQNFKYSSPEFFAIADTFSDEFIVYEFHSYRPIGYASNANPNSVTYPGKFFSVNDISFINFDKNVLKTNVFKYVDSVQKVTGKPFFLGEFGLWCEQGGGTVFLNDIYEICIEEGWHLALWDYRSGRGGGAFDYESKSPEYWTTVLNMFKNTGIKDLDNSEDNFIILYPNPTDDYLNLKLVNNQFKEKIEIYSIHGEKVKSFDFESREYQKIYVGNLAAGIYFIRIGRISEIFFIIH